MDRYSGVLGTGSDMNSSCGRCGADRGNNIRFCDSCIEAMQQERGSRREQILSPPVVESSNSSPLVVPGCIALGAVVIGLLFAVFRPLMSEPLSTVSFFGILIVLGLTSFVAGALILIDSFFKSIWWGLGSLFVPFVSLIYIILHWDRVGKYFIVNLGAGIGIIIAAVSMGAQF